MKTESQYFTDSKAHIFFKNVRLLLDNLTVLAVQIKTQQRMFLSRDEDAVNRPCEEHSCGEIVFIWHHPIAGNDIYS